MADGSYEGAERDAAEDTDELLYTDLDEDSNTPLPQDHCDLLLDAIDAQLSRLQVQSHSHRIEGISRKHDCLNTANLSNSQSVSRDTGLGSTIPTNDTPISCLDLVRSETKDLSSEKSSGEWVDPADQEEEEQRTVEVMEEEEEGVESQREQCRWRLERLLGFDACGGGGLAGELCPPPDSVCTEDFAMRFREEMVVGLPDRTKQRLARDRSKSLGQSYGEEEAERIAPEQACGLTAAGGEVVDRGMGYTEYPHHMDKQGQESQTHHKHGVRRTSWSGNLGASESNTRAPQRLSGFSRSECCLHSLVTPPGGDRQLSVETCSLSSVLPQPATVSLPGPPSSSSVRTGVLIEACSSLKPEGTKEKRSHASRTTTRHLAGVPVWNFDTVTIDSDLDSVRTEKVWQHIHSRPGYLSAIQSVSHTDGLYTDQSDYDTPTQEPRNLKFTPALRASNGNVTSDSLPLRKARKNRRDTHSRYVHSVDDDDDDEDTDEGCVRWRRRRRPDKDTGGHVCTRPGGCLVEVRSDWLQMEEELATLRQDCEKEEERLRMKRAQLCETELSLTDLLQKRKDAVQELEQLRAGAEQMEREGRSLEASLSDSKAEADSTSSQLRRLQRQRDSCLQEVRDLKEELAALCKHRTALTDGICVDRRVTNVRMSVLEREELDRQLNTAKTELFSEQRCSRLKLDSMQEKLDEAHEELQRVTEEETLLRDRCACLEEKRRLKQEQEEAVEVQVCELQKELGESESRVERIVAQKELQLLGFQEESSALQAERDGLQEELQSLRKQHSISLRETQEQALTQTQRELEQLKKELALTHEKHIQQAHIQAEEEKTVSLREQALSHTQHIESIQSCIQMKENEWWKLREALKEQQEVMRRREEELCAEAQEMMHSTIERERKKWEVEKEEALQLQCGILEEQGREALERVRGETEREKRNALALQNKVVELQTKVQELESEGGVQQSEQASALAAMRRSLREKHQAELQRLRRHMEQEGEREALRLEQVVQQAEEEAGRLQVLLGEREHSNKQATARLEQQHRHWAREMGAECQHLQHLLEYSGAVGSSLQLPHSPTVAQAVQTLQALREQLQQSISQIQQELDSQRRSTQQLSRDKERELRIQREQMEMEREQAVDSLKERLIQEHIEELSGLQRAQVREGGDEAGGLAASLRRQLQAKDQELRQVQRSMGQWKEQTTARLARKFEEELTAELERCKAKLLKGRKAPKAEEEKQRKLEKLKGEMGRITGECSDSGAQQSASSPSLHIGEPPTSPGSSDLASFKLLRHLQSRVKQLRAENQAHACSSSQLGKTPLGRAPMELAGSYLETITPSQECAQFWSRSRSRTVQSEGL
ncbi:trichohyalin isoform X3 [Coregonus clupeaformis]|uniref:trichohyalin isoform X3 n=1 Tax=Coregonus clupeaformis TaxID=59861 RepID=UPI001BE07AD3|nr:trichohyalin isoform X3 [Coregonus clupeaformis]